MGSLVICSLNHHSFLYSNAQTKSDLTRLNRSQISFICQHLATEQALLFSLNPNFSLYLYSLIFSEY